MLSDNKIQKSLTHINGKEHISEQEIKNELTNIRARLSENFSDQNEYKEELDNILTELTKFDLGRFLIKNKGGLSGYWTYYVIINYTKSTIENPIEKFILEKAPTFLATRERFHIFVELLQKHITNNMSICSLPCGLMGEQMNLALDKKVENITFVGIDLDKSCFELAKNLAKEMNCQHKLSFFEKNAWALDINGEYDIVTSNGLNIYEADNSKVTLFYQLIHKALKAGGKFIGSHLSNPPDQNSSGDWSLESINKNDLLQSKKIFLDILQATWANYRSSEQTQEQLEAAGFSDIEFFWDTQKIFYTFEATKK